MHRYLARVRRRAGALYALRALCLGAGAGTLAFAGAAAAVGPIAPVPLAGACWIVVAAAAFAGIAVGLRGVRALRGSGPAVLLSSVRPELASAARSAVELDADARARSLAPSLVEAHAARVRAALAQVPVERVVPWRRLRHPAVLGGFAAALLALGSLVGFDRSAAGAWALLHPSVEDVSGVRMAAVVSSVDVRLVYPEYLARPPVSLRDVSRIEAPRGTSVELRVEPRVTAVAGVLEVGDTSVRLATAADGSLEGRFVVREDAELHVRMKDEDQRWLRDAVRRTVHALEDGAPRVAMLEPAVDLTVELREEVPVLWEAQDDVGLRSVDLVVRTADGREIRRRMADYAEGAEPEASGGASVVAASFSAQPGDELLVWIEGRDGDEVSGPNVGRSTQRRLTVASEATRRAEAMADLEAVLEAALDALADRLEWVVPEDRAEAERRQRQLREVTIRFTGKLGDLAQRGDRASSSGAEAGIFREMARRVRRELARETRLHQPEVAAKARRAQVDGALVEELEGDSLLLADLLGRAQIEDAAAIARELDDLRRQMVSLVEELRRADSPEARQALMGAIARAQARMRELMRRLSQMARDVPQDYVNTDSLPREEASDALESLRQAVERGDLEEAARQLAELERQIDSIAKTLGGGLESFAAERFGPRERAMAEALDALAGLEAEQQRLAQRSGDTRRRAAERALSETGTEHEEAARRLARQAREVRLGLERVRGRGPVDEEAFERARQRMVDVEDALRTGDLGEARRMADEAGREVEDLSRDLDLSALMFPGADGDTSEAARDARRAAEDLRELRQDIDRAIPRVGDYVDDGGHSQMREDGPRQSEVHSAAERLAGQFEAAPDGAPLSPDAAEAIRQAQESMGEGQRALDRHDPIGASRAQEEAARRLSELRERLEREQRRQDGGGGGGREGGDAFDFRDPVRIPGADEFEGPMEMRRRLLDAMREGAPRGFEESVRRYYEELLR